MGGSYYHILSSPAGTKSGNLRSFIQREESTGQQMGFQPTLVAEAGYIASEQAEYYPAATTI